MLRVRGHAWRVEATPTAWALGAALDAAQESGRSLRGRFLVAGWGVGIFCRDDALAARLREAGVAGVVCEEANAAFRESLLRAGVPVLCVPQAATLIGSGHDLIVNFAAGSCEIVDSHRMLVGPALTRAELAVLRATSENRPAQDTSDTWEYPPPGAARPPS